MDLVQIIFGWPGIVAALVLFGVGIAARSWPTLLAGCLVSLPFLLYLFGTPAFRYIAPVLLLLNLGATLAVARGRRWLAAPLLLPYAGTISWVAYSVLTQTH